MITYHVMTDDLGFPRCICFYRSRDLAKERLDRFVGHFGTTSQVWIAEMEMDRTEQDIKERKLIDQFLDLADQFDKAIARRGNMSIAEYFIGGVAHTAHGDMSLMAISRDLLAANQLMWERYKALVTEMKQ